MFIVKSWGKKLAMSGVTLIIIFEIQMIAMGNQSNIIRHQTFSCPPRVLGNLERCLEVPQNPFFYTLKPHNCFKKDRKDKGKSPTNFKQSWEKGNITIEKPENCSSI